MSAWGLVGYGTGTLTLTEKNGDAEKHITTDIGLRMGAVGARGTVLAPEESGGFELGVRTDALLVRTTSDATDGMTSSQSDTSRLRLTLDGSRGFEAGGGTLTPRLEVGLRHDGGDVLPRTPTRRPAQGQARPLGGARRVGGDQGEGLTVRKTGAMVGWTGSADPSEAGREARRSRGPGSGYTRQRPTQQGLREMLGIEKVDHIGIRVSDKSVSIAFYERLGFRTLSDTGFEKGHPIIMQHPSGVVLNLLGPADTPNDKNILMDTDEKYPGITHVSFKVGSIDAARQFLAGNDIPLSGQFSFKDLRAVFIRDPDRNVIELDAYVGEEPETRSGGADSTGYHAHP